MTQEETIHLRFRGKQLLTANALSCIMQVAAAARGQQVILYVDQPRNHEICRMLGLTKLITVVLSDAGECELEGLVLQVRA